MLKSEALVDEVGVQIDPKTRVERWQEQVHGINRSLEKNPSPNRRESLKFQLRTLMGKLSAVPTMSGIHV